MPKTIKEVLEDLLWGEYDSEREKLEESMTEIRKLLKEAEPDVESYNFGDKAVIREYTANIEKRLG